MGPVLGEGRVAVDRRRAGEQRRALPRVCFRGEAHAIVTNRGWLMLVYLEFELAIEIVVKFVYC